MITKEYDLEVVTPMFLAGADQNNAEIRAASIKGQLRWWWRAINGNLPLRDLKKGEEDIFGSTSKRSSFSIFISNQKIKIMNQNLPSGTKVNYRSHGRFISIIDYLAFGIAVYDKKVKGNVYTRPHIAPGSTFKIKFIFYDDSKMNEIDNAFKYFIQFGGLGSKSRNGFGSLSLINDLPQNQIPKNGERGKFTTFSSDSQLFLFNQHNKWVNALVEIGDAYRRARLSLEHSHVFERRPLVARPLIVKNEGVFIEDRHAKSFFLHVDKINGKYQGKILVLPYQYKEASKTTKYNKVITDMCTFLSKSSRSTK